MPIDKIDVKERPNYDPLQRTNVNSISLPKSAAASLLQAAQTVDNEPLKIALEKLVKRAI